MQSYKILKNPMIKKALDDFKPREANPKFKLRVQIGTRLINKIHYELGVFKRRSK